MRLTLVITSLARGGAERLASILASAWAARGHEVTLLTLDSGVEPAYELDRSVDLRRLGLYAISTNALQGLIRNLRRIRILREAIRDSRPDVVVSFMYVSNVLAILATRRLRIPIVANEQTDPLLYDIGPIWGFLRRLTYMLCSTIVCPVEASLIRFQRMTWVRGRVISNPVHVPAVTSSAKNQREHVLVGMGRLVAQKGFDLLIQAFQKIAPRHADWNLCIYGEGPLLGELQAQAAALGLSDRVRFPGAVSNPFEHLRSADLFVLSSRFEGFGMALVEAMACGLAAVSFDCPEGPSQIIRHGVDGLLVPPGDVRALASSLDLLMKDDAYREALASRAPEVSDRFALSKVLKQWEDLFRDVVRGDSQQLVDSSVHRPGVSRYR